MSDQPRLRPLPYLLEFVVVVLGVTVSFGLDSWRHDRQQAKLHGQDIRSLLEDLSRDRERIDQVDEHVAEGKVAFSKILSVTHAYRRGDLDYAAFVNALKELKTPYRYMTFYMNNSTYKSLLSTGRLQLFPEAINKKLRDYYEYVSKRLEDNNDIVDQVTLRYYNEDHPWVNYMHGAEVLEEVDVTHETSLEIDEYFQTPGVEQHYAQLSFLHGTLSVYDRILIHGMQVEVYRRLERELEDIIERYAVSSAR
ncbi:MAG: hypothetical protein P8R46_00165 [Planctomycetota bacterium]|nr:hypothetical protein [Planctomycetota bacterium]